MKIAEQLDSVDGWLHPVEGFALKELARLGEGVGQVVEIGSFKGRSTCWLALGSREAGRGPVYAVDRFQGSPEHEAGSGCEVPETAAGGSTYPAFEANLQRTGLMNLVRPIKSGSLEAAKGWKLGAIRLLFIDRGHSYEASKNDFEAWSGHVCPRGCVAFHDIGTWDGVTRYYNELLAGNKSYREVAAVASLRVVQKVK